MTTTPARRPNIVEIAIDIVNRMEERDKLIDEACRLLPDMREEIEKQSTEYLRMLVDMLNDEPSPFSANRGRLLTWLPHTANPI